MPITSEDITLVADPEHEVLLGGDTDGTDGGDTDGTDGGDTDGTDS